MKKIGFALAFVLVLTAGLFLPVLKDASGASSSVYHILVTRVKTSAPSYTDGATGELNMDTSGRLRVTQDAVTGTAGSAASGVLSVQGIASGTALQTQGTGTTGTPLNVNIAEKSDEVTCFVASTATTSTQITGCEVQTGKSFYITSMSISGDAISATGTPAIIQSGTSTACTGPHVLAQCWHVAMGH